MAHPSGYPKECPLCGKMRIIAPHVRKIHGIGIVDLQMEGLLGPEGMMDWDSDGVLRLIEIT